MGGMAAPCFPQLRFAGILMKTEIKKGRGAACRRAPLSDEETLLLTNNQLEAQTKITHLSSF